MRCAAVFVNLLLECESQLKNTLNDLGTWGTLKTRRYHAATQITLTYAKVKGEWTKAD